MQHQCSEAELRTQACDALRNAGIPIQPQHFPGKYHHEAVVRACPSIPTPRERPFSVIEEVLDRQYSAGSFESFQAPLAGALIHLMFLYPATCLKAIHDPEAKEIFEMAAAFDWEVHVHKVAMAVRAAERQARGENEAPA